MGGKLSEHRAFTSIFGDFITEISREMGPPARKGYGTEERFLFMHYRFIEYIDAA